jgi:DNA-binding NarL/FixJ family response regulator
LRRQPREQRQSIPTCAIQPWLVARAGWRPNGAGPPPWAQASELAPRHAQLAACLAIGLSDQQIAKRLGLSVNTVRSYTKALYRRLETSTRVEVARIVLATLVGQGQLPDGPERAPRSAWARALDLPPRLARVAACVTSGLPDKQTAEKLGLSTHTVRTYVKELFRLLEVNSRTGMLMTLLRKQAMSAR